VPVEPAVGNDFCSVDTGDNPQYCFVMNDLTVTTIKRHMAFEWIFVSNADAGSCHMFSVLSVVPSGDHVIKLHPYMHPSPELRAYRSTEVSEFRAIDEEIILPRKYLLFLGRICRDKGTMEAIEIARKLALPLIIAAGWTRPTSPISAPMSSPIWSPAKLIYRRS